MGDHDFAVMYAREGEIVLVIDVGSLIEAFGGRAREERARVGVG